MSKVGKLILFSEEFGIDPEDLKRMDVFNPTLNLDTKLFIDPILLKSSKHKLISEEAVSEYNSFFSKIISLLSHSVSERDFAFKSAKKIFIDREITGTCIGYGTNSIRGRSISQLQVHELIKTAKDIIDLGITDPELFSLLSLFDTGIGPDSISDITTKAILHSLLKFTNEIADKLSIKTVCKSIRGEMVNVIPNPCGSSHDYIVLLPSDILRTLPVVSDWSDISDAAYFNKELRERVNFMVSEIFKQKTKELQHERKMEILHDQDSMRDLVDVVKGTIAAPYDSSLDNERFFVLEHFQSHLSHSLDSLRDSSVSNSSDIREIVEHVIDSFKFLIEEKGLWTLLWKEDKIKRCKEEIPQKILLSMAWEFCRLNNIDISPEVDTGSGLIDFKFSRGASEKVIVGT